MSTKTGIIVVRALALAALMWLAYQYAWHKEDVANLIGGNWFTVLVIVVLVVAGVVLVKNRANPLVVVVVFVMGLLIAFLAADNLHWSGLATLWLVLAVIGLLVLIAINLFLGYGYFDRTYVVVRDRFPRRTTVDPTPDPTAPAPGPSTTA